MSYGGISTKRIGGLAQVVTKAFESLGVLNKGSAAAAAAPDAAATTTAVTPVSSNALNVTRVGGLAALVSSVGAAAIALFGVKTTDKPAIVAAAYASVGAIVAAALIAAAVIVAADIRTRGTIAVSTSQPANGAHLSTMSDSGVIGFPVDLVRVNAAGKEFVQLMLPDASQQPGARLTIKRIDADPEATVHIEAQPGQTIDGAQHHSLERQWTAVRLFSTLENWEMG